MLSKNVLVGEKGRQEVLKGVKVLFDAVSCTLSPQGQNAVLERLSVATPHITKDGVTVAKEIFLKNEFENLGVGSVRESALQTFSRAGDGTTTSIILSYYMLEDLFKKRATYKLCQELQQASELAVKLLNEISIKVDEEEFDEEDAALLLSQVAEIASNGDQECKGMVFEAAKTIGKKGTLFVEQSFSVRSSLIQDKGVLIKGEIADTNLITRHDKKVFEARDCYVLLYNEPITAFGKLERLFNELFQKKQKEVIEQRKKAGIDTNQPVSLENVSLVIISRGVKDDALNGLIANHLHNWNRKENETKLWLSAFNVSGDEKELEELFEDLAVGTGGLRGGVKYSQRLDSQRHFIGVDNLGRVDKITIHPDKLLFVPFAEHREKIEEKKTYLLGKATESETPEQKAYFKERYGRLNEGMAIIQVGGLTSQERQQKFDRFDDATCAVNVAREVGVVPGGGITYNYIAQALRRELNTEGANVVAGAIESMVAFLLRDNISKVDLKAELRKESVKNWNGVNLWTEDVVCLFSAGILDATQVLIESIRNSISVSKLLFNSNSFITFDIDRKNPAAYQ